MNFQHEIKQELIWFYDRRFTYQMGRLFGINLRLEDVLLRLGPDSAFRHSASLECGGTDDIIVKECNEKAWDFILALNPCVKEPSIEKCGTSIQITPIPNKHPRESDMPNKRSDRVTEEAVAKQPLTSEAHVMRADTATPSEVVEYNILTKQALGPDALDVNTTVFEYPGSTDAALSDVSEDEVDGVSCRLIQGRMAVGREPQWSKEILWTRRRWKIFHWIKGWLPGQQ